MAKIPDAVATPDQVGIAEPQPARTRVTGFENPMGQVLDQASRQAAGVAADFQTRDDKQNLLDYSSAQSSFLQQKVELDQQFAQDKDFATAPDRYKVALQKLGDQFGQSITDPTMRNEFSARVVSPSLTSGWTQLYNLGKVKEADAGKASLLSTIETNTDAAMNAPDELTRTQLIKATNLSIDAAQAHNWITATDAVLYKQKANQDYIVGRLKVIAGTQGARAALAALAPPGSGAAAPDLDQGVQDEITTAATATGQDPQKSIRVAQIESSGDPHAAGGGLFQVQGKMAEAFKAKYGVDPEKATPEQQIEFYHATAPQVDAAFTQLAGHKPSDAESYLAWQQGAGGAAALVQNPDKSAIDTIAPLYIKQYGGKQGSALAQSAIIGNVEPGLRKQALGWTSQQFTDYWAHRYDNQPGTPSPVQVASLGASDAPGGGTGGGIMTSANGSSFAPTGTFVDQLPPDTRADLIRQYTAEVKAQDAEAQRNNAQGQLDARTALAARAQDDIASIGDTGKPATGAGISISEMLAAGMKAPEISKVQGAYDLASRTYAAKTQVALATPDEEQALLTKFTPKGDDYAAQKVAYDALVTAIQAKHKALDPTSGDPAGYVLATSQTLRDQFIDASQHPADPTREQTGPHDTPPTKIEAAVQAMDAAYDHLGVPNNSVSRPVMSKAAASGLVQNVLAQPPADRANAIMGMAQTYGSVWPRILGSMVSDGNLPIGYEMIPAIGDPNARTLLANALADPKKIKDSVDQQDQALITSALDGSSSAARDGNLAALATTLSYASGGAAKFSEIRDTLELLAQTYAAQGMSGDVAAQKAIALVTTDKYDFHQDGGHTYRVPAGQLANVEARGQDFIAGLKPTDLAPLRPVLGVKNVTQSDLQIAALDKARASHWRTAEDDQGLVLYGPDDAPIMGADGNRIELRFAGIPADYAFSQGKIIAPGQRGYRGLPVR